MKTGLLLLSLILSNLLSAQNVLKGRVLSDGKPLIYATIGIASLKKNTLTNEQGKFTLSNLPAGKFLVQVSIIGFEQVKIWVVIAAQNPDLTIEMKPLNAMLNEVSISGTLSEVSRSASAVPVEIYGQQFFKKNPSNSLFESLQMINGVQPTINCNVCNTGDIRINGLDGPYTLVLIDGMPIVSSLSTVYGLSGIPNSMIEKVEVIKGPAASLYGSEAVGGIINVITKSAVSAPRVSVDFMGSSYLEKNLDLGLSFHKNKWHSLLSANYFSYTNRVDLNQDNFTDVSIQNRVSLFAKVQYKRSAQLTTQLATRYYYEDRFGGEMNWDKSYRGGDSVYGESISTKRYELIAMHPFLLAKQSFRLQISFNLHDQNSAYGTQSFIAKQLTSFNQLLYDKKIGARQKVLLGATLRYTSYNDNTVANTQKNDYQKTLIPGLFAQDEIQLNASQTLLVGARLDHYFVHGFIFAPRVNYKLNFGSNQTLRVSAGNGFRVVNIFTEDHAALTGAREVVVANNIKPEESWNINVQYSSWVNRKRGFLEWDATVFYTWFGNKIIPNYDKDPNKIYYENTNESATSRGITFNVDADFTFPLKVNAGITLLDVFTLTKDAVGNNMQSKQVHAPGFSGTFQLSYSWKQIGLSIDYTGQVYGPMRLPILPNDFRPAYSPWYVLHNIQISKKFSGSFELYGGIKNLFNFLPQNPIMRWWDPFDKTAGDIASNPNGYTFDPSYNYAPMYGRRFFIGLRYTFK